MKIETMPNGRSFSWAALPAALLVLFSCGGDTVSMGGQDPDGGSREGGASTTSTSTTSTSATSTSTTSTSTGHAGGAGSGGSNVGTAGAGGSVGTGGSGGHDDAGKSDAAPNCNALLANVNSTLQAAQACNPSDQNPTLCKGMVEDLCCNPGPIPVASDTSDATKSYLAALDAWKKSGCTVACPAVVCPGGPATCKQNFNGAGFSCQH